MGPNGTLIGSPTAQLQAFAQSVYKLIKNRYYDDLNSSDGQVFLGQIADWLNEYIDELEYEVNSDGEPIDWIWVRKPGVALGTATTGANSITWDSTSYNNLICGTDRFVQVLDASGSVKSQFTVVAPADMSNDNSRNADNFCTLVNGNIMFSRPFTDAENNCTIVGDVTAYLPRVTTTISATTKLIVATNVDIFKTVKPLTLLKLGTTKNAILPDIVQGGLNPAYTQKYNDLLTNAINRSEASSVSPTADYTEFGAVRGVGF
jgi:hypothetical protein